MPPNSEFTYVLIPAEDAGPIQTRTASKAGGLSDDALVASAKIYFAERGGGAARVKALDDLSPPNRAALAKQLRERAGGANSSPQMSQLSDDALIDILRTSYTSTTCEITALTVPTPDNDHLAVSMYGSDGDLGRDTLVNRRATDLMVACGHNPPPGNGSSASAEGVRGDVFVGRCRDDEAADVWERVDFTVKDADPKSEWCRTARKPGGGGGRGTTGGIAPSLSGVMSQTLGSSGGMPGLPASTTGGDVDAGAYRWSQTADEVELKFAVPKGTKSKYIKVSFGRRMVRLTVAGQTLVNGETGGDLVVDECTYTLQDDVDGDKAATGRELCVTLGKADISTWPYAISPKS